MHVPIRPGLASWRTQAGPGQRPTHPKADGFRATSAAELKNTYQGLNRQLIKERRET